MKEHMPNRKPGRSAYRDGCRCAECTADNTQWTRDYDARRRGRGGQPLGPPEHTYTPQEQIEQAIARTGSVDAAVLATGAPYRKVLEVWQSMEAAIAS
jgi:hypothetical protein